MEKNGYDLIVIGGGPGGYSAAVRASELGMATALVEARALGGTCLNRGCVPTAAMLHSAGLLRRLREGERFGICAGDIAVDYPKLLAYRQETVRTLVQDVEQLLDENGVVLYRGTGTLTRDGRVKVRSGGKTTVLAAKNVLLAAGSYARRPNVLGVDLPGVTDSDGALAWDSVPESVTIIGGGAIGVEYAQIFSDLGSRVALLGTRARLLPGVDRDMSQNLRMILRKRGVDVRVGAAVTRIEQAEDRLRCVFSDKSGEASVCAQRILYAVGRVPYTEGLFEPGTVAVAEDGHILTDRSFQTNMPGVYAVGDVIGGPQTAHLAMAQGAAAAEHMAGESPLVDVDTVPFCVYTDPEVVSVGLTEAEARARAIPVRTGKCVLGGNGRSVVAREERGSMKLVVSAETGKLLGAQLMCARAGDMAGELVSAVSNGFTAEQLLRAVRPHPTYNEALTDALKKLCSRR